MKCGDVVDLVEKLIAESDRLKIHVKKIDRAYIIDTGIVTKTGLEVGKIISEISMNNLSEVNIEIIHEKNIPMLQINIITDNPVTACLCSQSATWALKCGESTCYISGPGKVLLRKPRKFFEKLESYVKDFEWKPIYIVECIPPSEPSRDVIDKIMSNIQNDKIYIILTSSKSMSGMVQICSRVIEVLLMRILDNVNLDIVNSSIGTCIIPPVREDYITNIAACNDSIRYTGTVSILLNEDTVEDVENILSRCVTSEDAKPFIELVKIYGSEFLLKAPIEMFSVSQVTVYGYGNVKIFGRRLIEKIITYFI